MLRAQLDPPSRRHSAHPRGWEQISKRRAQLESPSSCAPTNVAAAQRRRRPNVAAAQRRRRPTSPPPRVAQRRRRPASPNVAAAAPRSPNSRRRPASSNRCLRAPSTLIEILWRPRGTLCGCWSGRQSARRFLPLGLRVSLVPTVVLRRLRRRGGPLMAWPGRRQVLSLRQAPLRQVEGVAARVHWTVAPWSLPPRSMRRLRRRSPFGIRACRALTATTRRLRRCTRRTASCLSLDKTALRATPTAARPLALAA